MALTKSQIEFLKGYKPQDNHFTSREEIHEVGSQLDILNQESLLALRNDVVRLYTDLQEKELVFEDGKDWPTRTEKYFDYSVAMMSVTAIIDHYRFEHRGEYPV